ncbi:NAD(P)/FAD-dependent oxidoreductase [Helicovermis profundi]|uniref:NAD(P)/FAD-dependent oxidoreductase n=1 Tax=Helicovermis profundi TaxID=3065157 RepID=A0AAU9EDE6_9FIRM|nr:NAD(P)/FAD-dependent oxidoreductase [Clostridia bacterium S502]
MIRVNEIKVELNNNIDFKNEISKKLRISKNEILSYEIFRESIDARKGNVKYVYTIDVELKNENAILKKTNFKKSPITKYISPNMGKLKLEHRPIIVGFGPSGMFAALLLSENGYKPLVFERGENVEKRTLSVEKFWKEGVLNTESNVQFGEGGAGTFSDGKLTTRIKDLRSRKVLEELVKAGAPSEILFKNKPHIGTDLLKEVVIKIREKIIKNGGEVIFNSRVNKINKEKDLIKIEVNNSKEYITNNLILAIGHSARDTFEELYKNEFEIKQKPFAIGMRIEHKQKMINKVQYGNEDLEVKLGSAEYHLTYQTKSGRSVYTFCMCPGGKVVASSSEKNTIVTNGMSEHLRNEENANSALLVSVYPKDFESEHPLAGMYLQRKIERKAFEVTENNYFAPSIRVGEFLEEAKEKKESVYSIESSYKPGVEKVHPKEYLPDFIVDALKEALPNLNKRLKGFSDFDALLTGPETRSSSPIRIVRNLESFESTSHKGIFPCGEGAGYAGGIVSSAVDGLKVAEKIIEKYSNKL